MTDENNIQEQLPAPNFKQNKKPIPIHAKDRLLKHLETIRDLQWKKTIAPMDAYSLDSQCLALEVKTIFIILMTLHSCSLLS